MRVVLSRRAETGPIDRPADLKTVRHERLLGRKRTQEFGRREATHGDLGTLEANWPTPCDFVHADQTAVMLAEIQVLEEPTWSGSDDPQLFCKLAACGIVERFAGHDNATHEHVIHAWKEVLRGRSTVDEGSPEGIATRHCDRPMQESLGAHFSAIDATHRSTLDIDDLDELFDQLLLTLRRRGRGRFGLGARPTRPRAVVATAPTSAFLLGWGWRATYRP